MSVRCAIHQKRNCTPYQFVHKTREWKRNTRLKRVHIQNMSKWAIFLNEFSVYIFHRTFNCVRETRTRILIYILLYHLILHIAFLMCFVGLIRFCCFPRFHIGFSFSLMLREGKPMHRWGNALNSHCFFYPFKCSHYMYNFRYDK